MFFKGFGYRLCVCALFLSGIGLQRAGAQVPVQLSFSPAAGDKDVAVTVQNLPAGFKGELFCQIGEGKLGKAADLQSPSGANTPVKVPCLDTLTLGKSVNVLLEDASKKKFVFVGVPKLVMPGSKASAKTGLPRDVAVAVDVDGGVKVTIAGTAPADAAQMTVTDPTGKKISTSVTPNPDGSYGIVLTPAAKQGDAIDVVLDGTTWSRVVGPAAGSASLAPADAASAISVTFAPDPKDSQTTIAGVLTGDTTALAQVQAVYVEVLNGMDVVQGPLDGKYTAPANSFMVTTTKALVEGQSVHVHLCGASPSVSFKGTTTKDMPTITGIASTAAMKAGLAVSGTGTVPTGATILSVDSPTQITISQNATAAGTAVALQFVQSGSSCIQETATAKGLVEISAQGTKVDVTSLYDLGRVKTYFSVGAEFEGSKGSLGSATGFFGINIDENWLKTGPDQASPCYSAADVRIRTAEGKVDNGPPCGSYPFRFLINTYFEGDLTEIPLTSSSAPASSGTTPTTPSDAAATTPTTGSSSSTPSTLNISSAKGGYVEGGVYTPILLPASQWSFRGQSNALFFAPLLKYAFLDPGSTPAGATTAFNAYRAYGGGVRVGHFRLPAHFDKHGPELLSYVDITIGKWENFRNANGTRGLRLDATGRYKIPYTVLYVGFDANVGPGGSDYRLFVGGRVDASSILGKLLPASGN